MWTGLFSLAVPWISGAMATPAKFFLSGIFAVIFLHKTVTGASARAWYRVTTILENPFTIRVADSALNNGSLYEGFLVDILQELSQILNFDYELDLVKDGRYGAVTEEGKWSGMIGHLVRGEADIAAAPLSVASMRAQVVDFTQTYMLSGPQILMKKPIKAVTSDGCLLLEPLTVDVWILTIVAYIVVSVVLYVIWRWSPFEWGAIAPGMSSPLKESFNLKNSFFFSLSTMLWQGYRVAPRSVSGRIITGVWWVFTTFLLLSYTASLTGHVLARYRERADVVIQTFDDLAKSDISYGAVYGGSTSSLFRYSKNPIRHMMWEKMSQNKPSWFVNTTQEGISRVQQSRGSYAFIMQTPMAEFVANQVPCDLMVTGEPLTDNGYAFACRKGSGVCAELNHALLRLKESERLHDLRRKWFFTNCIRDPSFDSRFFMGFARTLTLRDFALASVLLLIGIVGAVVALVIEIVVNRKGMVVVKAYNEDQVRIQDNGDEM